MEANRRAHGAQQRDKWTVRVEGIDTETGRVRLRQIGTLVDVWDEAQVRSFLSAVADHRWGGPLSPGNFDQTLERLVVRAGVARLTSHGLRHTSATHMVRQAADAGELRAVADVLGHSPEMLMKTYAHALPDSIRAVADRIGARSGSVPS